MIRVRAADAARAGLLASGAAPAVGASEDDARAVSTGERLLVTALVYPGLPQCPVDPRTTATIAPRVVRLPNLRPSPDQPLGLDGALVAVVNGGVLVERDPGTGVLRGVPMGDAVLAGNPETGFHFPYRPRNGGVRPRDNERAGDAENERALEGSRFGEVNAYYHADRTLAYANGLLAELGEPPLPRLRVVVDSHPCSHLPGHGQGDCDRRGRKAISYGGGHYRRPDKRDRDPCFNHRPTGMNPTGEVHLGPGNGATKDADGNVLLVHGAPYTRKPSHNAGIITHEVGHHIVSHIADFRCNRDRPPDKTSHRKIHLDEGFCDYWSAVMLDTPDIFAWHRAGERPADRGNRDLSGPRTTADFVLGGIPHENGNIWSSALWDLRAELGDGRRADLLAMQMLVLCGRIGADNPTRDRAIRARKMARKDELRDGLAQLLAADEVLYGGAYRARILDIFARRGIDPKTPDSALGRR